MKIIVNILNLIAAMTAFVVAYLIVNGTAQSIIHFADPLNEMACFFVSFMIGIGFAFMSFEKVKS
tara:strand:- start:392 stop:586 length:195 start_codon:yes stop_codon:yes gene_type:complete